MQKRKKTRKYIVQNTCNSCSHQLKYLAKNFWGELKISISGVRGIYGHDDLTLNEAAQFAGRFANLIKSRKCIVARDTRPSGYVLSQIIVASLMAAGIDVYNLGVASTPAAFREARRYGAGIIVTASHNPLEWNGLKFIIEGRGLFEDELEVMLSSEVSLSQNVGKEYVATTSYVDDVAALAGTGNANVGIDAGGGASCGYPERLFKKIGIKFQSINCVPGISSRGPDPTADTLTDLRLLVTANRLDLGFALDLDGDRLVVVNGKGEKLSPDATLLLCVARAVELGTRKFVTSIDTSVAIGKYIKEHGGTIDYSKVGEANVVSKMLEVGAEAGGEGSSAGFIMPRFNMCRDGLLAAATIATLGRNVMNDCLSLASQYAQVRSKIAAPSSLHSKIIERLPDALKAECSQMITGDGVKGIIDEDSWLLVRPSNTEHAIRLSVESRTDKAQSLYNKMSEKVQHLYEEATQ